MNLDDFLSKIFLVGESSKFLKDALFLMTGWLRMYNNLKGLARYSYLVRVWLLVTATYTERRLRRDVMASMQLLKESSLFAEEDLKILEELKV